MKLFAFFLLFANLVIALPVISPIASGIADDRPVLDRPGLDRPIEPRPVEPRPIESHPIGSRSLEVRQKTVPNAYIIEFKQGYTHDSFKEYLKKENVSYEFRYVYDNPNIFYGVSIQLNKSSDYGKVTKWEGIQRIDPVQVITIPEDPPYATQPVTVNS